MSAGYKANMAAAGESDGRLEQRLQQNSSAFSALSLDNAVAAMPRLQVMPIPVSLLLCALFMHAGMLRYIPHV
jgi:hypothetical protein